MTLVWPYCIYDVRAYLSQRDRKQCMNVLIWTACAAFIVAGLYLWVTSTWLKVAIVVISLILYLCLGVFMLLASVIAGHDQHAEEY